MPEGSGGPYRVVYFESTINGTRTLALKASELGIREHFIDSLKILQSKLKEEPLSWGDPLFRFHHLGLEMRHGIQSLVHVYYAVDEPNRVVYVRDLLPLPWKWKQS